MQAHIFYCNYKVDKFLKLLSFGWLSWTCNWNFRNWQKTEQCLMAIYFDIYWFWSYMLMASTQKSFLILGHSWFILSQHCQENVHLNWLHFHAFLSTARIIVRSTLACFVFIYNIFRWQIILSYVSLYPLGENNLSSLLKIWKVLRLLHG